MDRKTLCFVGRSRIELLTEQASRMGNDGEFIKVTAVPKDGLRRVIIGESLISEYTVEPDETFEFSSLMHLCVQAMVALTHPSAIFWCFGEQRLDWLLKMKSHWGDALRYVPSEQNYQFFVFEAEAGRAQNMTIWPILQNELSLHLFAIEDRNAPVHRLLDDIYHGMESHPEESKLRIMVGCLLLMEQTSRYSRTTAFLPVSEIPAGGMARVILYVRYSGKVDMTPYIDETKNRVREPRVDEMKEHLQRDHFAQKSRMVCEAFASLHQSAETITCLGMQPSSAAIALKEMLGEQIKTGPMGPSRRGHHFILITRPAHSIDENTIWPYLGRDDGCRLFGPVSGATKLSSYNAPQELQCLNNYSGLQS